jgi:hypothetical protein
MSDPTPDEDLKNELVKITAEIGQIAQVLESLKPTILEHQDKIDSIKASVQEILSDKQSETEKELLEVKKLNQEIQKLEKENLEPRWAFRFKPIFQGIGSVAVIGSLVGAVVTAGIQTVRFLQEREQKVEIDFRSVTDELGSDNPGKRLVAAIKIARFLEPDKGKFHPEVVSVLSKSFFFEKEYPVAEAIALSLLKLPQMAQPQLASLKRELNANLPPMYKKGASLWKNVSLIHRKLLLVARLEQKTFAGSAMNLSRAALGNRAWFRCATFAEEDLKMADLSEAEFWDADLYHVNFEGATLRGVNFWKSVLTTAIFRGAELEKANFKGARLWRSDFRGAERLNARMFENASWATAHFNPGFIDEIREEFPGSDGRGDQRNQGRQECKDLFPDY